MFVDSFTATIFSAQNRYRAGATVLSQDEIVVWLPSAQAEAFDLRITVTGAKFNDWVEATAIYTFVGSGSTEVLHENTESGENAPNLCQGYSTSTTVTLRGCAPSSMADANDDDGDERLAKAVRLDQIQFGGIGGLTTAGHSISLTVSVINPTNNSVIETGPSRTVVSSKNTVAATIPPSAALQVDPESTPAFTTILPASGIGGSTSYGKLGAVNVKFEAGTRNLIDDSRP